MYVMSRRALDKSSLLSLLLDDVVGTQMIRQDNRYVSCFHLCNYRYVMSRWTPDQSSLLSLLLDEVVGNQEIIRQDYCNNFQFVQL